MSRGDNRIGIRFDGTAGAYGTWASPGETFSYYVDDMVVKHESEFVGVEYVVDAIPDAGYPLWRSKDNGNIITEADAVNNEIKLSFDVLNIGTVNATS